MSAVDIKEIDPAKLQILQSHLKFFMGNKRSRLEKYAGKEYIIIEMLDCVYHITKEMYIKGPTMLEILIHGNHLGYFENDYFRIRPESAAWLYRVSGGHTQAIWLRDDEAVQQFKNDCDIPKKRTIMIARGTMKYQGVFVCNRNFVAIGYGIAGISAEDFPQASDNTIVCYHLSSYIDLLD